MKSRLKASSLGMAMIIALLIALLCGFYVMRAHLNNMTVLQYSLKERLERNCESGIQYLLSGQTEIAPDNYLTTDLFEQGLDSVTLYRKTWGAFEIIGTRAFDNNDEKSKWAISGGGPTIAAERTGFYVNDLDRPISVCGKTLLNGKTFIPDEGIKRAYIEGQNYIGDKLIYGEELRSGRHLPPINTELLQSLSNRIRGQFPTSDSLVEFNSGADTITNSFLNSTVVYSTDGILLTGGIHATGNVVLFSKKRILVQSDAQMNGVLLFAPEIEIESGFNGSIQAFASQQLLLGEDIELNYPSVLGLLSEITNSEDRPVIQIGERCKVHGSIIAVPMTKGQNNEPTVATFHAFELEGELYVDGNLDLKGSVFGSVWCHKLVLKTNSGVYENHLLNVVVDPLKLSPHFLGSAFFTTQKRSVLQWL